MRKFLALLCLLPLAAYAEQKGFDAEFDGDKPWPELQALLPAYPKPENLLPFDAGPASRNQHYIDAPSITVADGAVRYTLVIKSPAGAMNISYEGMHCASEERFSPVERRIYATGRSDNTWARARGSKWEEVENIAQHYAQRALARYFFCPVNITVKDPAEAIRALKRGSHPRVIQ